jgi:hypothetical protein
MNSKASVTVAEVPGEPAADTPMDAEGVVNNTELTGESQTLEVPEKFRNADGTANVEQILKAHGELETKLGSPAPAEAAEELEAKESTSKPSLSAPEEKGGEGFLADMASWSAEYAKGEGLSDATYTSIEKQYGVDRAGADRVIQGEQAIADAGARAIFDSVGGEDNFKAMMTWSVKADGREAADEFSAGLGEAIGAGDQARIGREIAGLEARWKEGTKKGWSPELTGRDAAGNSIQPFANAAEMSKAQRSEEYQSGDEAFHRVFDQRLKLSMDMGTV